MKSSIILSYENPEWAKGEVGERVVTKERKIIEALMIIMMILVKVTDIILGKCI